MKTFFTLLLGALVTFAQAQSADEIIKRYTENMGGLENFNKVKTARIDGTLTNSGYDFEFIVQVVNGKSLRMEVPLTDEEYFITVYNNGKGWTVDEFSDNIVKPVTGSALQDLKNQASLADDLTDYKKRGFTATLLPEELIDNRKMNVISLKRKDGDVTIYYIDAKTHRLEKSNKKKEVNGVEVDVETTYNDPRMVDGLLFYFNTAVRHNGKPLSKIQFRTVYLNVDLSNTKFEKPE